jgi:hypothetical protein
MALPVSTDASFGVSPGRWVLRITAADLQKPRRIVDVAEVQTALDRVAERVRREGPGNGRM